MTEGYGRDDYGRGRYGSTPALGLTNAFSLGPTSAVLQFTAPLDLTHGSTLDPLSYSIPGLTVLSVQVLFPDVLRLVTTVQGWVLYEVTVHPSVRSTSRLPIEIDQRVDTFSGYATTPSFFATAQSSTRVQVIAGADLLSDLALAAASSYQVFDLLGNPVPVILATPRTYLGVTRRVDLDLGVALLPNQFYRVVVANVVFTVDGRNLVPNEATFLWKPKPLTVAAAIPDFSGEVSGGLFGTPAGLVFFSPSLEDVAPLSAIQIDELSVCSRAYEVYEYPKPVDPLPLSTFGGYNPGQTNNTAYVLWAPFPRLNEAKMALSAIYPEVYAGANSGRCVAVLDEPHDPLLVSLLNNPYWQTFGTGVLHPFKTASNLAPIPAGTTTTITIVPLSPTVNYAQCT